MTLAFVFVTSVELAYTSSEDPTTNKLSTTFVSGKDRYSLLKSKYGDRSNSVPPVDINKLATIVPVFGIGALNSGLTLIDDNASKVKSLSTAGLASPFGLRLSSYKNTEPPSRRIFSLVDSSALK